MGFIIIGILLLLLIGSIILYNKKPNIRDVMKLNWLTTAVYVVGDLAYFLQWVGLTKTYETSTVFYKAYYKPNLFMFIVSIAVIIIFPIMFYRAAAPQIKALSTKKRVAFSILSVFNTLVNVLVSLIIIIVMHISSGFDKDIYDNISNYSLVLVNIEYLFLIFAGFVIWSVKKTKK